MPHPADRSPRPPAAPAGPKATRAGPHSGTYTVPANQTTTRFGLNAVSSANESVSVGNVVDYATFVPADCPVVAETTAGTAVSGNVLGPDQQLGGVTLCQGECGYATAAARLSPVAASAASVSGFVLDPNGHFTYTPPPGYSGPDSTTFLVNGLSTWSTLWVNVKPATTEDVASTPLNTGLTGPSVLSNDVGTTLSASLGTAPSHGTASVNSDGTYTYTPQAGYSGPDSFGYTATDASGLTAPATVRITVNGAPNLVVTLSGPSGTLYSGQTGVFTVGYSNVGAPVNLTPVKATGVSLRFTQPAYTVINTGASDPGWTCRPSPNQNICDLSIGSLAGGAAGSKTFALTLLPTLPVGVHSFIAGAAIVDDLQNNPPTGTPTTTPQTGAANAPNLNVWQSGPPQVFAGQLATYNIDFSNLGDPLGNPAPSDASGVVISDVVPPFTTFSKLGSAPGWSCPDGAPAGTVCTLNIGSVPAGTTDPQPFTVKVGSVPPGSSGTQNHASIADDGSHGVATGSGTAPASSSSAANPPNFAIAVSPTPGGVQAGQPVTFTVNYTNSGDSANPAPSKATAVTISETVPEGMTFTASGSTAGWSCADGASAGTACTLVVGTLNAGASGSVAFVATPMTAPPAAHQVFDTATIADDGSHGPATGTRTSSTSVTVSPGAVSGVTVVPPASGTPLTGPPSDLVSPPVRHTGYDYGTPGGAAIVAAGGPDAFEVVSSDPHHSRSPLSVALVRPGHLATDAATLSSNLLISLLVLLLMGFSAELVNRTWITHQDRMRAVVHRVFGPSRKVIREDFGWVRGTVGVVSLILFAMVAAVIETLLDPHAAFDRATTALWLGLSASFLVVTLVWEVPEMIWLRRRTSELRSLRLLPEALPIAGLCVLLSRVTGLHPGYLFGVLAALVVVRGRASERDLGKGMALCAGAVVLLAAVAYLLTGVVGDAVQATPGGPEEAPFYMLMLDAAMPSVVMASLGCLVFGLLPLHMMRGAHLAQWSKPVWAAFYGFGTFALLALVIHPSGGLTERTRPLVMSLLPYVLVTLVAVSFYLFFRLRYPSPHHHEPAGEQAA